MPKNSFRIDGAIEGRCTKCRKNTSHRIVSLGVDGPDEVRCSCCQRQHKYRPPYRAVDPVARLAARANSEERQEWQRLRDEMSRVKACEYSMDRAYKARMVINHPLFGMGLVQRKVGAQKIEVLFEDGKKMMRCR